MTDPKTRGRLVDLSVIATSALVLGGGVLVVADVDRSRPRTPSVPDMISYELVPEAPLSALGFGATAPPAPPSSALTTASVGTAPAPGLVPAPRPARRVVVVRRSRAS